VSADPEYARRLRRSRTTERDRVKVLRRTVGDGCDTVEVR
jgi:hypothetical protein